MYKFLLLLLVLNISNETLGQVYKTEQWADSLRDVIKEDKTLDLQTRVIYSDSVQNVYERLNLDCKLLSIVIGKSGLLDGLGYPDSALSSLIWVETNFNSNCDSIHLMEMYANYSYVYLSLDELVRNDSICEYALQLWNDTWEDKIPYLAIVNNLSISKAYQGDLKSADSYFRLLLNKSRVYKIPMYEQRALINLGNLKGMQGDLDSAYYYNANAAKVSKLSDDVANHVGSLLTMANIERERKNFTADHLLLDSALNVATRSGNLELLATIHLGKSRSFQKNNEFEKAYQSLKQHQKFNEQFLNEANKKAVAEMTKKYESEKQHGEIQDLKLVNLNSDLENERIDKSRSRFIYAGLGVLVLAVALWSRLRYIRKAHDEIKKEKEVSEGLLLNILPEEVAQELKEKGYADARNFDNATILFSDFKDFTVHSENMTPRELVHEIDVNFKYFDELMSKYGVEKIKTIGDAYMAAGGLPDPNSCAPRDVVLAGLDMQEFVVNRRKTLEAENKPVFEMRVGIHTGTVIAGIVGVKKFQYDIWGDTVNTAARMESSSEVTQVNISESTYELIKDDPLFKFTFRGMIDVKGKGELKMYFVERVV